MASQIRGEKNARWVGYLGYDVGRLFESLPWIARDDLNLPLFCFGFYESKSPAQQLAEAPRALVNRPGISASLTEVPEKNADSSLSKSEYIDRVSRAIDYIHSGDIFQVNLSQRFTTDTSLDAHRIWQNLIGCTPASYGAFLDTGDHVIICNSPELFLRVTADRRVITRPIKGTRPNLPGMEEQLQNSEKDRAELNMIVDLERNDLGRVCEIGSVHVTQPRSIEMHPTVCHGVATIEGTLREEVTFVDLLQATFPGGSITGAPKIRAMQIIEELEPVRRGPYCGAIGYLDGDGSMQFNVAIRTMIARGNKIHIPVGGGIVADSDPHDEYKETLVKSLAMFAALNPTSH